MRILFDSKDERFKRPFGCLRVGESMSLSVHIPKSIYTASAAVFFESDGIIYGEYVLCKDGEYDGYDIYSVSLTLNAGLFFYYFRVNTFTTSFYLFKENFSDTNMESGEKWQLTCIPKDFSTPESFKGNVMYQIFPDRFSRSGLCNTEEKLRPFSVHDKLTDCPDYMPDEKGEVNNNDFFGGNLRGIEEKLEYISSLGVKTIYLNPIFKAYSNHRYDTCDYKEVDPMLGTYADFCSLCKMAKEYGIGIILDGVFSHTGIRSIYFEEAIKNSASKFVQWYKFKNYPNEYGCWWGIKTLPEVEEMTRSYLDYIINDEDSVVAHWLRAGAMGFRLDVADELPDEFIYLLRRRVKGINPAAVVIGEVWEDASNKVSYGKRRSYFTNAELDSVMNYPFMNAIIDFVSGKTDARSFSQSIMTITENYPKDVLNCLMNSLSTHDTVRAVTRLSGIAVQSRNERAQFKMSDEQYKTAIQKLKKAAFLQYVLPGNPCIYYGDEIGMQGYEDPFNRRFFSWESMNMELLSFYRRLGQLKNKYKQLRTGDVRVYEISNDAVVIKRENLTATVFSLKSGAEENANIIFSCDGCVLSE